MMCQAEGCQREAVFPKIQLCVKHYDRRRRLGDENAQVKRNTRGMSATEKIDFYRVLPDDLNQCFGWDGYFTNKGYAVLGLRGKPNLVHRLVYEIEIGPIPDGKVVDHVCHNWDLSCEGGIDCLHRRCTNPRHLQVVTHQENISSAQKAKRPNYSHPNSRKTHCPKNHEYTEENTVYRKADTPSGVARRCRECLREKSKRDNAKRADRQSKLRRTLQT